MESTDQMMAQSWRNAVLATSETSQTAVTADFLSHLLLLFDLLVKNPAAQKQTAVTAYFSK